MTNANMKAAVIDTMVFAYGLLNETDFAEDSLTAISCTQAIHVHPAENYWQQALVLACEDKHPAYDTLFIAVAKAQDIPLGTYDKKLLHRRLRRMNCPKEFTRHRFHWI